MMQKKSKYAVTFTPLSLTLLVGAVLCSGGTQAQNSQRQILAVKQLGNTLQLQTNDGVVEFTAYGRNLIESRFLASGKPAPAPSHALALEAGDKSSLNLRPRLYSKANQLVFDAGDLRVQIQRSPYRVSYFYKQRFLTAEQQGFHSQNQQDLLDFNLTEDEVLYGAGSRALGMNRRGYRLPLYNKAHYGYEEKSEQMNFAIPLVYSSRLYGLHFDSPDVGVLDLDSQKQNRLTYEAANLRNTYQIFAADNWPELIATYTQLTGRQPLPPRWILGNFASRFGYHSEAEARAIVAKFKAEQIPLDAIVFDLFWFGKEVKGTMGNLAFDKDNFPEPEKMMADFARQNIKTVLITEPFILSTSNRWQEAVQQDILAKNQANQPATYEFYFGQTGLIDIFDDKARNWFWQIYADLKKRGVNGWWGDLGEPEVHPAELRHKTGSANQVHNIYGHEWAKLIAQGYQREFPKERPFILMRAGYSGSQRYGLIPWSGDVNRSWGGLRSQPEIALQMGMQGLAYMHSDLGGFAGANLDDELYVRWLQYGVFQPVFRPHAQEEVPAEPVLRSDAAKALARQAIQLRYKLLPYNYTLSYLNSRQGLPLMRPLFFAEPQNPALLADASSYFWGEDLLVTPVLKAGQTELTQYFPKNGPWFDLYTEQRYQAGARANLSVVPDRIPVFVRAGAWIAMSPGLQNTAEFDISQLELHYYHDQSQRHSRGQLYDDDGSNAQVQADAASALLQFSASTKPGELNFAFSEQAGKHYRSRDKHWQVVLHQIRQKPRQLLVNQQRQEFSWDPQTLRLRFTLNWPAGAQIKLSLR